jgi:hypothetical protein
MGRAVEALKDVARLIVQILCAHGWQILLGNGFDEF